MSQLSLLTSLYVNLEQDLPGVSEPMMLQALQKACRELTRRSESFLEQVAKVAGVEYQQDYTLTCPFSLNAQVDRIMNVWVNSVRQTTNRYELYRGVQLRFIDVYIPHDLDDRLLTCGAAGAIGVFTPVADGSMTFEIDSTYEATGMDFSSSTTKHDVAAIMQTAVRVAMASNTGFVEWDEVNDKMLFWCESGEISYLTAGTTGTDISGATYVNGLTGTGVLSGLIEIEAAWRSDFNDSTTVPAWWLDRYSLALMGYAKWKLASMNKKPWTSRTTAEDGHMEFNQGLGEARRAADDGNENTINGLGA